MKHIKFFSASLLNFSFIRTKKQYQESHRMDANVFKKEHERNAAVEKDKHACVRREALEHNQTEEEFVLAIFKINKIHGN